VVADEFITGSRHDGTGFEQKLLQFSQILLTTAIRVRHKCSNNDTAFDRGIESFRDVRTIEPEDDEIDFFFGLPDCRKKFGPAVARLHDEFHG